MKNVGIIGCGAIMSRHANAVIECDGYKLMALCDVQEYILKNSCKRYDTIGYINYKKMIQNKKINFISIATPNSQHTEQAIYALENGCDVLIEKPVSLNPKDIETIKKIANKNGQYAYCVLQVRENPSVKLVKEVLERGLLGTIRGVNLIQRWQRPVDYFTGWRGIPEIGGGTLYECGIHYLDIMGYLFGYPSVLSSSAYKIKHQYCDIEDTIYCLFDFGNYGGTMEITIAAEPHNLECSLSILGSNGYLKIGGKAMNIVESANFLSNGCKLEYESLLKTKIIPNTPNSYGSYAGSCPNHPDLYKNIKNFNISEAKGSLMLIDEIYKKSSIKYY
tara:strand:- start:4 stop:1005 length:1002 start_codon:yes stop_codon:yes gene_type:complete